MSKTRARDSRFFVILGIFFGLGFVLGFLTCFGYLGTRTKVEVVEIYRDGPRSSSADARQPPASPAGQAAAAPSGMQFDADLPIEDLELVLEEHFLGSDESGTYIGGLVANRSDHPFDAIRLEFDLNDRDDRSFASVTETQADGMEPGDVWEFTIYIPYTEMQRFVGYRLRSIMGVTK